ncbi:trans-aconitate 2-methyltransferase [Phyllobacterium sp. SB3]|uniref:trans-aconitate 2-methyltransferase n=1 Tax=Phyllobacterium sp. SB3 TaxID=3156073 RepID=UPI0032AF6866
MRKAGWSPEQYLKFEDERTRPANDLLAAVPENEVEFAVDLGCGPGNSTELLLRRYPSAEILGIDSSVEMIAQAKERLPDCRFEQADLDTWRPEKKADLLYANASMQWLSGHDKLFPQFMRSLNTRGSLAIQMPDNLEQPTHIAMREVASDKRWAEKLGKANATRSTLGDASFYYDLLKADSARVDIWRTIYHHPLQGIDGIVQWFLGSALRPYLAALNEDEKPQFLEKYKEVLAKSYRPMSDGFVLLPFPRLFIIATK